MSKPLRIFRGERRIWRPFQSRILRHGSFSFNTADASLFTFYEAYNLVDVLKNWAMIVNGHDSHLWKNYDGEREFIDV